MRQPAGRACAWLAFLIAGAIALNFSQPIFAQAMGAPPTFDSGTTSGFMDALSAPAAQGIDFSNFNIETFDPNATAPSLAENSLITNPAGQAQRQGVFQAFKQKTTWLPTDDLGFFDLEFEPIFAFPSPMPGSYFVITPGFGWHFVNGPAVPDMPAKLFDLYLDWRWPIVFSPGFTLDTGITPGLYSDFENSDDDAFRLGARVAGVWQYSPTLQIVAGIAYLDRVDVDWLPIGGIIYTPNPDVLVELMSPKAKIARRIYTANGCEQWVYLGGEFGGGSWSIQRASGRQDIASYYDLRLYTGFEGKLPTGTSWYVETGFVFNRNLEYRSSTPDFSPDSTAMFRLGFVL
ncbi:MAG: hypothetical protein MPJ50_03470 [Pirellulales bacterium]|nr:hypothetical protein [Pirellulales bacterium]